LTAALIVVALIVLATLAWVARPLLGPEVPPGERQRGAGAELAALRAERDRLLAALKDLEDDRATDKIGDADYAPLRARLTVQAVETLRRLDELGEAGAGSPAQGGRPAGPPAPSTG
jgi:hypothetical protein